MLNTNRLNQNGSILSSQQKQQFAQDGFLIIRNFISSSICNLLIERAQQLITAHEPTSNKTAFSSTHATHNKHQYFLDSGDKIHFFYEERALDAQGNLITDKQSSINKMGHALHDLDPVFDCFSRSYKIAALIEDLTIVDPLLIQSMYICKQPFIGGEVNCHQDSTYIYVKEQPVIGLWFALEDATLENGCLWAIPGGHKTAVKSRSLRDANNTITTQIYDPTPWNLDLMVPLEVTQGSLIVLHGQAPHMSKTNFSARSRHAYTLHIADGRYAYPPDNWLQRSEEFPFRGF